MKDNRGIRLIRTIIITGLAFVVNYGINLILTPYITKNVGAEAYGFVSLAKNVAQYATLITTALNSFASRYIAIAYHKKKYDEANTYFSSVFYGDVFLGTVILVIASGAICFLENMLNISSELITDVKILFFLTFINFWITTIFSVFSSAAYVKEKLDITGVFKGLSYVTEAIVLIFLYSLFSAHVFYVGIGLIALSLVVAISNVWISKRYLPNVIIRRHFFSIKAVKKLVVNGIWTSLNSLGNLLNSGLDLIICNLLLTPLAMGQVAIAKTIETIFSGLLQLVAQAFQPMFLQSYAENNSKKLLKQLKMSMKLSGLFSNLAFAGFCAYGLVYCKLWIPEQNYELIYYITIITVFSCISAGPMTPLYYIYTLTVKRMVPCIITIISGVLNVFGMYFLISYTSLGIYAVVLTTAVLMSIINFITNPLYMAKALDIPWWSFYPEICRNVLACIMLIILFKLFSWIYMPYS